MRILLVDPITKHRKLLQSVLEQNICVVDSCNSLEIAAYLAKTNTYDAVVSSYLLGPSNALHLCSSIRSCGVKTPILVFGFTISTSKRVELLDGGVDDLLIRPFSFDELLARLRAINRRGPTIQPEILVAGEVVVNRTTQRVFWRGKPLAISSKEFQVLEVLMECRGAVVSRASLYERVWSATPDPRSKTLESHIYSLRRKVADKGVEIQTVIGRGYSLL